MAPRKPTTTVVLTVIGVVLAVIAVVTEWPGWLIVLVFVAAAVGAHLLGRDGERGE